MYIVGIPSEPFYTRLTTTPDSIILYSTESNQTMTYASCTPYVQENAHSSFPGDKNRLSGNT